MIAAKVEGKVTSFWQDWHVEPINWAWMQKKDLDMQVTPAIFTYKGRELMVTGSKECRVYLIDPKSAGGENHQTPLVRTPLLCNEEVNFTLLGKVWGSMASWEDSKRHSLGVDAILGSGSPGFQSSRFLWPGEAWRRGRVQG